MTRVVISQPMYFPWVGFLAQMSLADVFIWLDDVQFSKGSFTNRVQAKLPSASKWMTIPLKGQGNGKLICDLHTSNDLWRSKHISMLSQSFAKSQYLHTVMQIFTTATSSNTVNDNLINSAEHMASYLGILPKQIYRSSTFNTVGEGSDRVLNIVKDHGGTEYITGHGAANYLDHQIFTDSRIEVSYMQYEPIAWQQDHGDFTPFVTGLDLIASRGKLGLDHLNPKTVPASEFSRERRRA